MYYIYIFVKIEEVIPFAISAVGVILDAVTTMIGLSEGFNETHPNYNPLWALLIFWSLIGVTKLLPRSRFVRAFTLVLSLTPFLGAINNSMVIIGA
ncbi:hypothetical protein MUP77_12110, partial [Candidatus Bathyarchaeota archaeon]|nr:hypothetical protein [Candidatus Bathyarchaeota archaeon]